MRSVLFVLAFVVGCAGSSAEPEAASVPEIEMAPTELMVPASQAEMLREEIAALKAEAVELREALAQADEPDEEVATQLAVTGANVSALEAQLRTMETELSETKARLAASEDNNRKLQAALDTTHKALLHTSRTLADREIALEKARADLDDAREDLLQAREFVEVAGWKELVSQTKLAMCQKGSARSMDACHERAVEVIQPFERVVKACLRSGQAAPTLRSSLADGRLPSHAVSLDDRKADGLYVLLCDPTLPEARALLASMERAPASSTDDLEDLDDEPIAKVSSSTRSERTKSSSVDRSERTKTVSLERSEPFEPEMFDDEPAELGATRSSGSLDYEDLDGALDEGKQSKRKKKDEVQRRERDEDLLDDADDDLLDEF